VQRAGQDGRPAAKRAADISSRAAAAFPGSPPTVIDTAAARRAADTRCDYPMQRRRFPVPPGTGG